MGHCEGERPAMSARPLLSGDEIWSQIQLMQREPFRNLLATLLECAPNEEALKAFAAKSPDRWMQAIAIAGRLSGYTEQLVSTEVNIFMQINQMSDGQLLDEYQRIQSQLTKVMPALIENPV